MKIKIIIASMLAMAALAGCAKEKGSTGKPVNEADVALLSIRIATEKETRGSGENPGTESALKTLYLVTFNSNDNVVAIPETGEFFIEIDPASPTPPPVKVSAAASKLLVIANPGQELYKVIGEIGSGYAFHTVNSAIRGITESEIIDAANPVTKGFAMINSGLETGKSAGDKITDPLISLIGKIKVIDENTSEEQAKDAAEKDPVEIKVERLASKLAFKLKNPITSTKGTFNFGNWTIDAVNKEFYPYAVKTLLSVDHTEGSYKYNFYTQDPNYSGTVGAGLEKGTVDDDTYEPKLATSYGWMSANITEPVTAYCVENTMEAAYQQFGNATRLVVKGTYYPTDVAKTTGDWFFFAGLYYKNLGELKTEYGKAEDGSPFKKACDDFYSKVRQYLVDKGKDYSNLNNGFEELTEKNLSDVAPVGGQVVKNGTTPVIRWYQDGLNYWFYEVRHDNEIEDDNAFGKYGVVRNNWYSLTLASVDQEGTPWYPEIDNPGPGDPDPEWPIDQSNGYLGISVVTAPWVIWDTEIGL